MTTSVDTPSALVSDLEGLTEFEADRIVAALTANYAPTTLAAYAWAWSHFAAWCAGRGLDPLPATAATVCVYLTERAEQGVCFGTLSLASAAISYQHRRTGANDPTDTEAVRQVRRGLRRSLGTAPIRQARPLSVADRTIVAPSTAPAPTAPATPH